MTAVRHLEARDGTRIAYRLRPGEAGRPALVFTSGYTASDFYWRYLVDRFEGRTPLVTWDLKGHGQSGPARTREAVTVEDSVDDLRRVLDACGAERAVLFAFSLGCQVILEAWRHMPDRIAGLVPILGTYERPFDNLFPPLGPHLFRVFRRAGPLVGGPLLKVGSVQAQLPGAFRLSKLLRLVGPGVRKEDMLPFFRHMARIHGPTWARMGIAPQGHSAEDLLPSIAAPTLVVAGGRDTFTPRHLSERMVERIPGAELLFLPDATHTGLFEYPAEIGEAVEAFLSKHRLLPGARPPQN